MLIKLITTLLCLVSQTFFEISPFLPFFTTTTTNRLMSQIFFIISPRVRHTLMIKKIIDRFSTHYQPFYGFSLTKVFFRNYVFNAHY